MEIKKLTQELNQCQVKPDIQLSNCIVSLEKGGSSVEEDKKALTLEFIVRKNALLNIGKESTLPLALLTTITVGCYLSWWIVAFNIVCEYVVYKLASHYMAKYGNSEISTYGFMNKMNYIALGSKPLFTYLIAAFSVYLLTTNFIANGLTVGVGILGSLLALAILIEVLAPVFSRGCKIYAEKHTRDLLG